MKVVVVGGTVDVALSEIIGAQDHVICWTRLIKACSSGIVA